jgi:hypothetical protein
MRKQAQDITVLPSIEQNVLGVMITWRTGYVWVLSCKPTGKRRLCRPLKRWYEIVTCHVMMIMVTQIPREVWLHKKTRCCVSVPVSVPAVGSTQLPILSLLELTFVQCRTKEWVEIYLHWHLRLDDTESNNMDKCTFLIKWRNVYIFIYVTRLWRLLRLKIRIFKKIR